MTTYKEIRGTNIEVVSSDPSNPVVGQVWYNSTDNVLKGSAGALTFAWATKNAINTARYGLRGAGTAASTIVFGGEPPKTGKTESYNGTNWTEVNDMNETRKNFGGAGTSTSAMACGDETLTANTETWNGTNWTEVNNLNTDRRRNTAAFGAGNTSGITFGGFSPAPGPSGSNIIITEQWNGTNWTEVNDMNTGRVLMAGTGIVTAALAIGGEEPRTAKTESWNGTNWTEVNDTNTARQGGAASNLSATAALYFGGETPPGSALTESWNGTNWTETSDLSVPRREGAGSGASNTTALAIAGIVGASPDVGNQTEEFSSSGGTVTFTDS